MHRSVHCFILVSGTFSAHMRLLEVFFLPPSRPGSYPACPWHMVDFSSCIARLSPA